MTCWAWRALLQVCHSKVEELSLPPGTQVDVLVSEPMGTLLVNERMLETYLYARDKFLKPGGKMFPVSVRVLRLAMQWFA
jgi:histone-arginine methyltransferase CARM1